MPGGQTPTASLAAGADPRRAATRAWVASRVTTGRSAWRTLRSAATIRLPWHEAACNKRGERTGTNKRGERTCDKRGERTCSKRGERTARCERKASGRGTQATKRAQSIGAALARASAQRGQAKRARRSHPRERGPGVLQPSTAGRRARGQRCGSQEPPLRVNQHPSTGRPPGAGGQRSRSAPQ